MKAETISNIGLGFVLSVMMFSSLTFAQQAFQNVIETLKDIGVFQFYLPFLISFAIIYALLLKIKVFGDQKALVTIIALAAAAFILVYVPPAIQFGQFLTQFFGNTIVVILTVVVILIFVSMLQSGKILPESFGDVIKGNALWALLLLVVLVAVGVFIASGGTSIFPGLEINANQLFSSIGGLSVSTIAIILLIVGTGLVVFLFARGSSGAAGGKSP